MFNFIDGEVLLFDKPYEWTSFDVVRKVKNQLRRHLNIKKIKVGHAGTLDPLATGLLIVCTGKKTKTIETLMAEQKEYKATIKLGQTTPSYDLETEVDQEYDTHHINEDLVKETAESFLGEQDQLPPIFSAKRINGKRAYEFARKGEEVDIKPNRVTIFDIQIDRFENNEIDFTVLCSKGTYIRSIAHDFGKRLNSGAHLTALRRTRSGDFLVDNALEIDQFSSMLENISNLDIKVD